MTTYIVTDSSACMTPELLAQNPNIKVVPFTITYPDRSTELDVPGADRSKLYAALKGPKYSYFGKLRYKPDLPKELPKTTQPNESEVTSVFEEIAPTDSAIGITISYSQDGGVSGSFNSFSQAAQKFPNIEAMNSCSASMGQGWIVLELARMAREFDAEGKFLTLEEAEAIAADIRNRMTLLQTTTTLRYLERGGRIKPIVRMAAEATGTLPIITLDEKGGVAAAGKSKERDSKARLLTAFNAMIELAAEKVGKKKFQAAFTHGEMIDGAIGIDHLIKMVQTRFPGQILGNILLVDQACVLYPYTGPDTYGMMLLPER